MESFNKVYITKFTPQPQAIILFCNRIILCSERKLVCSICDRKMLLVFFKFIFINQVLLFANMNLTFVKWLKLFRTEPKLISTKISTILCKVCHKIGPILVLKISVILCEFCYKRTLCTKFQIVLLNICWMCNESIQVKNSKFTNKQPFEHSVSWYENSHF